MTTRIPLHRIGIHFATWLSSSNENMYHLIFGSSPVGTNWRTFFIHRKSLAISPTFSSTPSTLFDPSWKNSFEAHFFFSTHSTLLNPRKTHGGVFLFSNSCARLEPVYWLTEWSQLFILSQASYSADDGRNRHHSHFHCQRAGVEIERQTVPSAMPSRVTRQRGKPGRGDGVRGMFFPKSSPKLHTEWSIKNAKILWTKFRIHNNYF